MCECSVFYFSMLSMCCNTFYMARNAIYIIYYNRNICKVIRYIHKKKKNCYLLFHKKKKKHYNLKIECAWQTIEYGYTARVDGAKRFISNVKKWQIITRCIIITAIMFVDIIIIQCILYPWHRLCTCNYILFIRLFFSFFFMFPLI